MDNAELHLQYRYAIQLIKGQRYAEAYDVLKVIDAERPNTKNVLYALAIAADAMGLTDEALELCDRLILEFDHDKAKIIRDRILQGQTIRLKALGDDNESLGVPSSIAGLSSGLKTPAVGAPRQEPKTETLWQAFENLKKPAESGNNESVSPPETQPQDTDSADQPPESGEEKASDTQGRKKWNFFSWGTE